jgi:hypothetical protein
MAFGAVSSQLFFGEGGEIFQAPWFPGPRFYAALLSLQLSEVWSFIQAAEELRAPPLLLAACPTRTYALSFPVLSSALTHWIFAVIPSLRRRSIWCATWLVWLYSGLAPRCWQRAMAPVESECTVTCCRLTTWCPASHLIALSMAATFESKAVWLEHKVTLP